MPEWTNRTGESAMPNNDPPDVTRIGAPGPPIAPAVPGHDGAHPFAPGPNDVPASDTVLDAIIADLQEWWFNTAESDFDLMKPKIGECTSSDLILMGQFMEHWMGLPEGSGPEAATVWYALGKVARAVSAYREGRLPSEDTLHDLCVYAMMARRIRQHGRWP